MKKALYIFSALFFGVWVLLVYKSNNLSNSIIEYDGAYEKKVGNVVHVLSESNLSGAALYIKLDDGNKYYFENEESPPLFLGDRVSFDKLSDLPPIMGGYYIANKLTVETEYDDAEVDDFALQDLGP